MPPQTILCEEKDSPEFSLSNQIDKNILDQYLSLKKKKSFYLGRSAAHRALALCGLVNPPAIMFDSKNNPLWPEGFTGSISHTDNLALAVVSSNKNILSLGIDLEFQRTKIPAKLKERICVESELVWCQAEQTDLRTLIIFSAKEAIYKALYPICKKFFGFKAVELLPIDAGKFQARLLVDLAEDLKKGYQFEIKYALKMNYIYALTIIFKNDKK